MSEPKKRVVLRSRMYFKQGVGFHCGVWVSVKGVFFPVAREHPAGQGWSHQISRFWAVQTGRDYG